MQAKQSWLDERLETQKFTQKFLRKAFPVHSTFFLGELALFCFVILVLTGVLLAFSYEPSSELIRLGREDVPAAYASVVRNDQTPFGYLLRQTHHWSAHLMIAAAILHLLRVFFTGMYKKPREINWVVGVLLLIITVFAAFSGYLLPFDEFAVTATGIGYNIAHSTPWIGPALADFIFAGKFPAPGTIPRFYAYHVMLIPLLLIVLISLHLVILIKQKHGQPPYALLKAGPQKVLGVPLWPHQTLMMLILFLLLLSGLFFLAGFFPVHPVEYYGPPSPQTPVVKPDWYLLWAYGALRLIPGWMQLKLFGATISSEAIGGVFLVGLVIVLLFMVPFADRANRHGRSVIYLEPPSAHPVRTALGVSVIAFFGVLMLSGYNEELGLTVSTLQLAAALAPPTAFLVVYGGLRLPQRTQRTLRAKSTETPKGD